MKIDFWIKNWTGDHQVAPDEEPETLLVDRIDAKGIPVYSASTISERAFDPDDRDASISRSWPEAAELVVDGFMHLRLIDTPPPFFDLFSPSEILWDTDRERGLLLLVVSALEWHVQGGPDWPYGEQPPLLTSA